MLTVTEADIQYAALLGVTLKEEPLTEQDHQYAADPRTLRTPVVFSVLREGRPIGRLRFTAVDCLYATKLYAGITCREDSVTEALDWIAPRRGHVRTGDYEGTETVTLNGRSVTRPRALTECGEPATSADFGKTSARVAMQDGVTETMCPACRAKLEGRGTRNLGHLSARSGSASVKQQDYLRRLLDEGAQHGRPYLFEARAIDKLSTREASAKIDQLLALKAKGWKGEL